MSKSDTESNKLDLKGKELVYSLFYEITSEIKGCKIEIDEEEFEENLRTISWDQLINYIKDSIKILMKKKFEEAKINLIKEEDNKIEINEKKKYENYLRKLENNKRELIKKYFEKKLKNEAMENKIEEYIEIEEEYEEMKNKLKYENGRFLDNDRKENEIIILRQENVNLKKYIFDIEKKNKEIIIEKEKEINNLKENIKELAIKIEEKQKELNLFSNININISNGTNKNNYSFYNFSHSNSSNNILSGNKFENQFNNNKNEKLKNLQKIKSKLLKSLKKEERFSNSKIENIHRNNLDSFHKYLINHYENNHLNNNSIKITKLPITNFKNTIQTFKKINQFFNQRNFSKSSRKPSSKININNEK